MVTAFEQGIASRLFCDSLIRNPPETFSEIRWRAVAHINAEEEVTARNNNLHFQQAKPKKTSKTSRPLRFYETSLAQKSEVRHAPYKKGESRARGGEEEVRPKYLISYKELITIPAIVVRLGFPSKADRNLGPKKEAWCDFQDTVTTSNDVWL